MNPIFAHSLLYMLKKKVDLSKPDLVLGSGDEIYMRRWWLERNRPEGCVYLHNILHDDDDRALHDHPWASHSLILEGQLIEVTDDDNDGFARKLLSPGDTVERKATDSHRLELAVPGSSVWTLFITGPYQRKWGFHTEEGWVYWKDMPGKSAGERLIG